METIKVKVKHKKVYLVREIFFGVGVNKVRGKRLDEIMEGKKG